MTEKLIKCKVAKHMSKIVRDGVTYKAGDIIYLPEAKAKESSSVVIIDEPEPVKAPVKEQEPVKAQEPEPVKEPEPEPVKEPEIVKLNKGGRPPKKA